MANSNYYDVPNQKRRFNFLSKNKLSLLLFIGRAEADITNWIEYFITGVRISFEKVYEKAKLESGSKDLSHIMRGLDIKQRKMLQIFENQKTITSNDIAEFFNFAPRTARKLAQDWVKEGFLIIVDSSKKARKYQLNQELEQKLYSGNV